jgi:hypothetical protein
MGIFARNSKQKPMNYSMFKTVATIVVTVILCGSCIQTEAPNAEADIESCSMAEGVLISTPQIENDRIILRIDPTVDRTQLALNLVLTPGATVEPPSGTVRNFREPQTYTVTSEDGKWKKTYTVTSMVGDMSTTYSFENYELIGTAIIKYYSFHELVEIEVDGEKTMEKQALWASGNSGYSIPIQFMPSKTPEDFPTAANMEGFKGSCVKLVTRSTGSIGGAQGMPIAAGNLFIGEFGKVGVNKEEALKATHFGEKFNYIPTGISGYYKYKAGEKYQEGKVIIPDKKDNFDIYGIMYEADADTPHLDGTNALTSPNLVSVARMKEGEKKETDEWTYFYIPFKPIPGTEIDPIKLKEGKYKVSLVFSSSIEGAYFNGAIGSTFYIDEVELIHE